ncbi:hypothetical protein PUN28_001921 [Cardiocondyla obscurior]|uniref:Uncharacterized protein n=1 Tax=Cardiocondyla obscurior TaxID=286306 RepID=A0AAW2GRW9_9HYME
MKLRDLGCRAHTRFLQVVRSCFHRSRFIAERCAARYIKEIQYLRRRRPRDTIQAGGKRTGQKKKKKQRDEKGRRSIDLTYPTTARKGGRVPGAWRRMPVSPSPVNMDESQ